MDLEQLNQQVKQLQEVDRQIEDLKRQLYLAQDNRREIDKSIAETLWSSDGMELLVVIDWETWILKVDGEPAAMGSDVQLARLNKLDDALQKLRQDATA